MADVIDFKTRQRLASSDAGLPAPPAVQNLAAMRAVLDQAWTAAYRGECCAIVVAMVPEDGEATILRSDQPIPSTPPSAA
ncbi:hypothetical protein ACJ4V0_15615 [Phreatobacter sp. HK31-P]